MENKMPKTYTILTLKLSLCLKFSTAKVRKKMMRRLSRSQHLPPSLTAWQLSFISSAHEAELTPSRCPLTSTGVPWHLWMHAHILSHRVRKKIPFQNIIKFLHILSQSYILRRGFKIQGHFTKYFQILSPTESALSMNGRWG